MPYKLVKKSKSKKLVFITLDKEHIYYMVYFDGMLASGRKASQKIRDMFDSDVTFKLNQFDKCIKYVNKLKEIW